MFLLLSVPESAIGENVEVFAAGDFLAFIQTELISFIVQSLDLCNDSGLWEVSKFWGRDRNVHSNQLMRYENKASLTINHSNVVLSQTVFILAGIFVSSFQEVITARNLFRPQLRWRTEVFIAQQEVVICKDMNLMKKWFRLEKIFNLDFQN